MLIVLRLHPRCTLHNHSWHARNSFRHLSYWVAPFLFISWSLFISLSFCSSVRQRPGVTNKCSLDYAIIEMYCRSVPFAKFIQKFYIIPRIMQSTERRSRLPRWLLRVGYHFSDLYSPPDPQIQGTPQTRRNSCVNFSNVIHYPKKKICRCNTLPPPIREILYNLLHLEVNEV